jgi:DnaJ-class molecular chaperone
MKHDLYQTLGVPKTATDKDIKKAYRRLAQRFHPDKGGNERQFKEISDAYAVLGDKQKRIQYDTLGIDAINDMGGEGFNPMDMFSSMMGGGGGGNPMDMFSSMMGGGGGGNPMDMFSSMMGGSGGAGGNPMDMFSTMMGGGGGAGGNPMDMFSTMMGGGNSQHKIHEVLLTLDEIYTGVQKTVFVDTKLKCKTCSGNGFLDDGSYLCDICKGECKLPTTKQIFPGKTIQTTIPCKHCNERGFKIKPGYECSRCSQTGIINKRYKYNLNISPGTEDGKEIKLEGSGDYIREKNKRCDLILKIKQDEHERFTRKQNDLFLEEDISFQDAICGNVLEIEHLKNKIIHVSLEQVIKPDFLMRVPGLGLKDSEGVAGDLMIRFTIQYPDTIEPEIKNKLRGIFKNEKDMIENDTLHTMEYFKDDGELYDDEDQAPSCAQQ